MSNLRQAAQAVIDRWDSPLWKDVPATAFYISALREALTAPEQEPHGWMIEGAPTVMHGAFAELDAKAEAKRIGGTCKAYPVYREPVGIEAITKERDGFQEKITAMCKAIPNYDWSGDSEKSIAELAKERDALAAEVARLDAGWHKANGDMLDAALERDTLMAAAKLALDALSVSYPIVRGRLRAHNEAIAALKKAGVSE